MTKKRSDERAALAEAILIRDEAEAVLKKHEAAHGKAAAQVCESEAAVIDATVALNEIGEAVRMAFANAMYADAPVPEEVSFDKARESLNTAQDMLSARRSALDLVGERKVAAQDVLARLEADVDCAARAVLDALADGVVARAKAADDAAWAAKMATIAAARLTTLHMDGRHNVARRFADLTTVPYDRVKAYEAIRAEWELAFAALKRNADAAMPEVDAHA